jgi:hypothetical protein
MIYLHQRNRMVSRCKRVTTHFIVMHEVVFQLDLCRSVLVSKTRQEFIHDFTLQKQEPPIHKDTKLFVGSGYQGLQNIHLAGDHPFDSFLRYSALRG